MKQDKNYWDNKIKAYLHDPIDKVFKIQNHEERAKDFLEIFGLFDQNDGKLEGWKIADIIASGFERGTVPSYKTDKGVAVDFLLNPIITHPTSNSEKSKYLKLELPKGINIKDIHKDVINFLKNDIGDDPNKESFSNRYKNDPEKFAIARSIYLHLALRFKLSDNNISNIGPLWHRLPADSRFPDHSIWQHNGLVSAINSSMKDKGVENIAIGVFSITPVQPFIAKARKLRDYWSSSILLSWLSFEGIKWVIENLGPDHILYPSLIDQPLINEYLSKEWDINNIEWFKNQDRDIASFPNKFLFLFPNDEKEEIENNLKKSIKKAWENLSNKVKNYLINILDIKGDDKNILNNLFQKQNSNFWNFNFSSIKLLSENDKNDFQQLLPESYFENNLSLFNKFKKLSNINNYSNNHSEGVLYSTTHSLVQSILASEKGKKIITRKKENGEKCHICGEFEVLNTFNYPKNFTAKDYKNSVDRFWENLKETHSKFDFKENEKLCSICLTKRVISTVLKKDKDHILYNCFKNSSTFPSTTEISLHNYYERENIYDQKEKQEKAQELHDNLDDNLNKLKEQDKYYAILMMDGDKMGELVNGKNLASKWDTIMHPDIIDRLKNSKDISKKNSEIWKDIFENDNKRLLTPSIHAAISESLGDFALYGVKNIVKKYEGKLIYAGGDDVAAILPISTVLKAAKEIEEYYKSEYRYINKDKNELLDNKVFEIDNKQGKLSLNLGKGDKISISAGILIVHHKENLSEMIARSHKVLDKAKDFGRDACSIELKKRSGGSRYFTRSWKNKDVWKNFNELIDLMDKDNLSEISTSLIYRLDLYKDGIDSLLKNSNREELLIKFFTQELKDSGLNIGDKDNEKYAKMIYNLSVSKDKNEDEDYIFSNEGLIMASFLGKREYKKKGDKI